MRLLSLHYTNNVIHIFTVMKTGTNGLWTVTQGHTHRKQSSLVAGSARGVYDFYCLMISSALPITLIGTSQKISPRLPGYDSNEGRLVWHGGIGCNGHAMQSKYILQHVVLFVYCHISLGMHVMHK